MKKWKQPRLNEAKTLNPSGLKEIYHSEKCLNNDAYRYRSMHATQPTGECICSVKSKMQKALHPNNLLAKGPWKGSQVSESENQYILNHPSGASMVINKSLFS